MIFREHPKLQYLLPMTGYLARFLMSKAVILLAFFLVFSFGAVAMSSMPDKKRLLIVSSLSEAQSSAFYLRVEELNPNVNGSFRPDSLNESDVVVYLLDSWSSAANAPGFQDLAQVFERVAKVASPAVSHGLFVRMADGRDIQFIFYSTSDTGYAPLKCFAADIAVEANRTPGDEFEKHSLTNCMNSPEKF